MTFPCWVHLLGKNGLSLLEFLHYKLSLTCFGPFESWYFHLYLLPCLVRWTCYLTVKFLQFDQFCISASSLITLVAKNAHFVLYFVFLACKSFVSLNCLVGCLGRVTVVLGALNYVREDFQRFFALMVADRRERLADLFNNRIEASSLIVFWQRMHACWTRCSRPSKLRCLAAGIDAVHLHG